MSKKVNTLYGVAIIFFVFVLFGIETSLQKFLWYAGAYFAMAIVIYIHYGNAIKTSAPSRNIFKMVMSGSFIVSACAILGVHSGTNPSEVEIIETANVVHPVLYIILIIATIVMNTVVQTHNKTSS